MNLKNVLFFLAAIVLAIFTSFFSFSSLIAKNISEIFLNLLQLLSIPLIFLSITSTITGMKNFGEMKKMGKIIFSYSLLTTLLAAFVALFYFEILHPTPIAHISSTPTSFEKSYFTELKKIFPSNLVSAFAENNVMGIVFFAFFFSIATLFLPTEKKELIHSFFSSLFEAFMKMTQCILFLLPLAIWAFTTLFIYDLKVSSSHVHGLGNYLWCILLANFTQGLVILPLLLKLKKISPLNLAKNMSQALVTAFFTKSSNMTLPITIQCALEKQKISKKTAYFSFPLCSVINMNACAGFILITVMFISIQYGMTFTFAEKIVWVFLATLAAIGNAGVPMGCYFLTSAFLNGMGIPLYLIGIILPLYTFLDMLETSINVWSDSCITAITDQMLYEENVVFQKKKEPVKTFEKG